MGVTRPVMRYHGGKWRLAPWIIRHLPAHRTYVEPFGGAASVLIRKPRSYAEVYNDLDGDIVAVFRALRDPETAARLAELVALTPYSRDEFSDAYEDPPDELERARRTIVRASMGFGAVGAGGRKTGFRSNVTRSGTTPATDWHRYPALIPAFVERLRGVVIENRPAEDVIRQFDGPDTLFYVDPPYPHSTRTPTAKWDRIYKNELSDDDHRTLAAALTDVEGAVVVSGYACALYDDELFPNWRTVDRGTHADGAAPRTERLWISASTEPCDSLFAADRARALLDRTDKEDG